MWEQRYGVPVPERTPVAATASTPTRTSRCCAARSRSASAACRSPRRWSARAPLAARPTGPRSTARSSPATRRPAPQVLRKRTLIAISRAIEDETLARAAGPVVFGAFQRERNYRAVQHRYRRLAENADAAVVFADFAEPRDRRRRAGRGADRRGRRARQRVGGGDRRAGLRGLPARVGAPALAREDAETADRDRRFETLWTMDPRVVRQAALVGLRARRAARRPTWPGGSSARWPTARSRSRRPRRR